MLVQDRSAAAAAPKSKIRTTDTFTQSRRLSQAKPLDLSACFSDNLCKIVTIAAILITVAAVFFLRNVGDSAALLCFQSQSKELESIHYPGLNFNSIYPIFDKSTPYRSFRSEKWIVVSVSASPPQTLRHLLKIKGWQLLAIGDSQTPAHWNLTGAIYLSLEDQANLGFRVVDYLPYNSYVRKSVGYLFAIQHGAKKIFDADDRGEIIDEDLGKHFDIELIGEAARQEVILQYSHHNPNRTVVNPYIHFGQRSVWPRGLPLENVGEIGHEEFYTEVFGGRQFIQQGLSNGLPDVDSVFYFTRKSVFESFDIRFDHSAPKVALPQGLMVPVNSFNTIFHSSAFWALMLPVSVSSMASDVLRGYWAQRLLWEIDGYVVVYPPTVFRQDRVQAYPFSEEKDIHVNVARLIKFLVSWSSTKQSLFDTILDLSYAMAVERFWSDKDVQFTAAWLQDLLAVGYKQPRQMSTALGRTRATIGHGDRKEFVPQKIPSVHLGVEETETVNYEIGNLIRWRKNFGNLVLIMFCSGPVERTALEWRLLYGRIFKTVIILSKERNEDLVVERGQLDQAYKDLPKILKRYKDADGFLFLQDNTILNYWNLLQADRNKLWITDKSWSVSTSTTSEWSHKQAEMVKQVVNTMPAHLQVSYKEAMTDENSLAVCCAELFYIPRHFASDFQDLVGLVGNLGIHHKVAIPMFFLAMDSPQNYDSVLNKMVFEEEQSQGNLTRIYDAQAPAVRPWSVSSEAEFIKLIRVMAEGDPLLLELV
uniref:Glycosyltransferase STELLO1 n=1 Tax=Kalanchoe fedtschenkoi TaxID=63787 RepID=A0A7N0UY85_KALFE